MIDHSCYHGRQKLKCRVVLGGLLIVGTLCLASWAAAGSLWTGGGPVLRTSSMCAADQVKVSADADGSCPDGNGGCRLRN